MKKLFYLLFLTCIAAFLHSAPREIGLTEILALLKGNNLDIRRQALTLKEAELVADNAWNILLPSISPTVGFETKDRLLADESAYSSPPGSSSDSNTLTLGFGINSQLAVGQVGPIWKNAILERDIQSLEFRQLNRNLTRNTTKLYYNLLAMRDNLVQLRNNIELARQQYELVQQRYNNGLVSQVDLLQAQVNYQSTKPGLRQAELLYRKSLQQLLRSIGLIGEQVELAGELVPPPRRQQESSPPNWATIEPNRLDFRVLGLRLEQNQQNHYSHVLGLALPRFGLGLSWRTAVPDAFESDTTSWDKDEFRDSLAFSLSLGWELSGLIPGSRTSVDIQTNTIKEEQVLIQKQQLREQSQNEVGQLLEDMDSYQEELEVNRLDRELARRNFELSQQSYQEGLTTLLDVDRARANLLNAEQSILTTTKNLLVTEQDLLFVLGVEKREQLAAFFTATP